MMGGGALAAFAGMLGVIWVISMVFCIFAIVCMWKIFQKAGYAGWKSLIPFYNTYIMFQFTWGKGIMFLLLLIPFVNIVIMFMTYWKLSLAFDGGIEIFLFLVFLPVVGLPLIAFSKDAQYVFDFAGNDLI